MYANQPTIYYVSAGHADHIALRGKIGSLNLILLFVFVCAWFGGGKYSFNF